MSKEHGVKKGQWWRDLSGREFRVMSVAEGYAMVRRKGCVPFVSHVKQFDNLTLLAVAAKESA